jgi:hypothetical protein
MPFHAAHAFYFSGAVMGGFNLPLFILFIGVAIVISVALSFWTDLSKLAVLVMSPLAAWFGLFAFSQLIDFILKFG